MVLLACIATMATAAIDSVVLTASPSTTVAAKGTIKFTAVAKEGDVVKTTAKFNWSCKPAAGKISTAGVFTAAATAGQYADAVTVTVTGSNPPVTASSNVTIIAGPAAKVLIDGGNISSLDCAAEHTFTAVVTDTNGNVRPDDGPIVFSLPAASKAGAISPDGDFVAGATPGTYSNAIIATYGKISGKLTVTVKVTAPTTVKLFANKILAEDAMDVQAGGKVTFTAKGYDLLDREIAGLKFAFAAEADAGVIQATSGSFTAATMAGNTGTVSARALVAGVAAGATGETAITVVPAAAAKVTVASESDTVEIGNELEFTASVIDKYENKIPADGIVWTVKATAGTIGAATGIFTAGSAPGKYTGAITATFGKVKGTASVTVTPAPPDSVKLMIGPDDAVADGAEAVAGSSISLKPEAYLGNAKLTFFTFKCTADPVVGTISTSNTLSVVKKITQSEGTITIQPMYQGANCGDPFEANITVIPNTAKTVVLDPTKASLVSGEEQAFSVTVKDAYENVIANPIITWTATPAGGGTIDADGLFTAGATLGACTVKATALGSAFGTATVTVTPPLPTSVSLMFGDTDATVTPADVAAGSVTTLKPKAYDGDTEITGLTFKCTAPATIGTISTSSVFTAVQSPLAAGVITIQPMYLGVNLGPTFPAEINVVAGAPKTVTITPATAKIAPDESAEFSVTAVKDAYGNEIVEPDLAWTVSPTTNGTIDDNGTWATYNAGSTVGTVTVKATATNKFGNGFGTATVTISNDENALKHLQRLINEQFPQGPTDIATEQKWFADYLKANPGDRVGMVGASITSLSKTIFTLADKYGMSPDMVTEATTFKKTVALSTTEKLTAPQNLVIDLLNNQNGLAGTKSASASFASGAAVGTINGPTTAATNPTPDALAADVKNVLIPAVKDAISKLGTVPDTDDLVATLTDPDGATFTVYGYDVRAYRAGLRAVLGVLDTVSAYNWTAGTFNWNRSPNQFDANKDNKITPDEYLPKSPFGTLTDKTSLANGWTALSDAIADAVAVSETMNGGEYDQTRVLAKMADAEYPVNWAEIQSSLNRVQRMLAGPTVIEYSYWMTNAQRPMNIPLTIDLKKFWDPGVNLRSLMPTFTYETVGGEAFTSVAPADVPDMTLGGLLPNGPSELPGPWYSETFNFMGRDNSTQWYQFTSPMNGSRDVAIDESIEFYADYNAANAVVKLYKLNAAGRWENVALTPDGNESSYYYYLPTSGLAYGTWYKMTGTSGGDNWGRTASYFQTEKAPGTPAEVFIDVRGSEISPGESVEFTAWPVDSHYNDIGNVDITWTVSPANAGTIQANGSTMTFTAGNTEMDCTVRATATNALGTAFGTADMTIVKTSGKPRIVTISPTTATVAKGASQQFSVLSVTDDYNQVIAPSIEWTVTPENAGTLDPDGTVAWLMPNGNAWGCTVTATAYNDLGQAVGSASVSVTGADSAKTHLQKLINDPYSIDITAEHKWFDDYTKANANDQIGKLGLSISSLGKTIYDLAFKYMVRQGDITEATTFKNTMALATGERLTKPQNMVFDMITNRSALPGSGSAELSFARGTAVGSGLRASGAITPDSIAADVKNVLIPAVKNSIALLGTTADTDELLVNFTDASDNDVNLYGYEVRAYRAGLRATLALLDTVSAYSWSAGTFDWNRSADQFDTNGNGRTEPTEYMPAAPFATLTTASLMSEGWTALTGAISDAAAVSDVMNGQNVDPDRMLSRAADSEKWAKVAGYLSQAQDMIDGTTTWPIEYRGPMDNDAALRTFNVTVDLRKFWNTPITNLRSIMPTFTYTTEYGRVYTQVASMPDKTLGGVLPTGGNQLPDYWWKDNFNFMDQDTNSWWACYFLPDNGELDILPNGQIGFTIWQNAPAEFSVRLYKENASHGWDLVPIHVAGFQPPPGGANVGVADVADTSETWYEPNSPLAAGTWYKLVATSMYGRNTSYFRTALP